MPPIMIRDSDAAVQLSARAHAQEITAIVVVLNYDFVVVRLKTTD